jgi:hypothetical protein
VSESTLKPHQLDIDSIDINTSEDSDPNSPNKPRKRQKPSTHQASLSPGTITKLVTDTVVSALAAQRQLDNAERLERERKEKEEKQERERKERAEAQQQRRQEDERRQREDQERLEGEERARQQQERGAAAAKAKEQLEAEIREKVQMETAAQLGMSPQMLSMFCNPTTNANPLSSNLAAMAGTARAPTTPAAPILPCFSRGNLSAADMEHMSSTIFQGPKPSSKLEMHNHTAPSSTQVLGMLSSMSAANEARRHKREVAAAAQRERQAVFHAREQASSQLLQMSSIQHSQEMAEAADDVQQQTNAGHAFMLNFLK